MIDIAKAAPSIGSVPLPSSSIKTSDLLLEFSIISLILLTCPENDDRFCSKLCSSPMSASTLWKYPISVFSPAGIGIPDKAIKVKSPATFNVTVFPPVFGPVISIIFSPFPTEKLIGTTFYSQNKLSWHSKNQVFPIFLLFLKFLLF